MNQEDQVVQAITHDGKRHLAIGDPELIAERLTRGQEVVCEGARKDEDEYVIRILGPQSYLRYPEAVIGQ